MKIQFIKDDKDAIQRYKKGSVWTMIGDKAKGFIKAGTAVEHNAYVTDKPPAKRASKSVAKRKPKAKSK